MTISKEIGGPLSLELPLLGEEYFQAYDEKKRLVRLDCGRSACEYAILHIRPRRVWLPVYNCETIENRVREYLLKRYNCEILFYNIDEDFMPILSDTREDELVIWVNFYGTQPKSKLTEIEKRFPLLLIDNTQAFFEAPMENAYNIYSCRKFFGVSDGGYLVLPQDASYEPEIELPESKTPELSAYLLTSLEFGGNAVYHEFKRCQAVFSNTDMARWWAETLNDPRANDFEKYLASYLLPIPMDQRYSVEDMNYIADLIDGYMKGK